MPTARPRLRLHRSLASAAMALAMLAALPSTALPVAADTNPVVTENAQPGSGGWGLSKLADDVNGQIKGYASASSVTQGGSISLYVSVNPAQTYTIDVFRMGWYAGAGARKRLHAGPITGTTQATCAPDATTGLIACGWAAAYSWTVPSDWTSGVYLTVLTNAAGYQNYVIFVVRDGRPASFVYQWGVNTAEAYNDYPNDKLTGKSLYEYNSYGANTIAGTRRAVKVSFDRPFTADGSGDFFRWDVQLIRWLEKSGYDVTYSTDVDTHANGSDLLNHKAFFSTGHDEYWSNEMYNAAQAARDAGIGLAFFGANAVYWQVRYEASAAGVPNRVLVCYKNASIDPVQGATTTVLWRAALLNRSEQRLMGVQYTSEVTSGNNVPYLVTNSSHWVYNGTGFHDGDAVPGIVGYEMDRYMANYPAPTATSWTLLSQSPFTDTGGVSDYANSSIYQAPSGAVVFASGTMSWSWALDNYRTTVQTDARIQQTTRNLLNAFLFGAPGVLHDLKLTAPATASAGQPFSVSVTAEDGQGNPVTTYGGTVHFSSSDTSNGVVLPPDSTLTSGQGSFSVTLTRAGPQTVTVSDALNRLTTAVNLSVSAQSAGALALVPATATPTAGTAFPFTVTAQDAFGNTDPSYAGTVHFSSSDTSAGVVLPPDTTLTAGKGTFSAKLVKAASQTLTASDTAGTFSATANLTVNPGAASTVLMAMSTTAPTSGTAFGFTVTAQDAVGNTASAYAGTLHFSSSDSANGVVLPPDSTLTNGQGSFSATLITSGPQTLTASDAANSLSATANLTVSATAPSAVHDLKLTASSSATSGQMFPISVTAEDAQGNPVTSYSGTVHFSSSDSSMGVVLPPDSTLTNGQGIFSATLIKAGSQSLTASDAANNLATATSLTVNAAPASRLILAPATAAPTAGSGFSVTVTAQDSYGNTDPNYAGTVHFSTTDTSAGVLLPPDSTLAGGQRSFTATLIKAGAQTLTASDAANAFSTSANLTVTPAPASKLVLVAATTTPTAGTNFSFAVTAQDPYTNIATSYAGTVHFSSSDTSSGVVLPVNSTLLNGQGSFSAKLIKAGPQTLTASDSANALSATASLTVNAAPASKLISATSTAGPTAGNTFGLTVTAQDPFGNTATSYAGTVHFSSSDTSTGVVLPADSTLSNGTRSFSARLIKAGAQSLTTADAASGFSATANLTVVAAPASKLVMVATTTTPTAGTSFSFTVTAQDPYGNTDTNYAGTVHFSSSDTSSGVVLPANSTLPSGTRSFSATLIRAGAQSLTTSDAASGFSATANVTVVAAPASKLVLSSSSSASTAGTSFSFTVTAQDPYGNTDTNYAGTVHFSSSDSSSGAVLPANSTLINGARTFSATLDRAGAQAITAVDTVKAAITGSLSVQIIPAEAANLGLTVPSAAVIGQPFNATVTLTDRFGNVATGYRGTVSFNTSDLLAMQLGKMPADYSFTAADAGIHTFSATLMTPPSQTITVFDNANGTLSATSPPIAVGALQNGAIGGNAR